MTMSGHIRLSGIEARCNSEPDNQLRWLDFLGGGYYSRSVIPPYSLHCRAPLCRHLVVALMKPGYHLPHRPNFRIPLYNRQRRHSTLGYDSPAEYEARAAVA